MADAFISDNVKIYIDKDVGTAVAFTAVTDEAQGKIFSFDQSGGAKTKTQTPIIGGGYINVKDSADQIEISMDVLIDPADPTYWDSIIYGSGLTSATNGSDVTVGIMATSGTDKYTILFNNVFGVSFDRKLEAGDFIKGTLTLNLSERDKDGSANITIGDDSDPAFTVA